MKPYMYNLTTGIGLAAILPILYLVFKNGVYADIGVGVPVVISAAIIFIISQIVQVLMEIKLFNERISEFRIIALIIMLLLATFIPLFAFVLNPIGAGVTIVLYAILTIIGPPIVLILCLIRPKIRIGEGLINPFLNATASGFMNFLCMASVT